MSNLSLDSLIITPGMLDSALNFIGALALLLLGWIVALLIAGLIRGLLRRTTLDERVAGWLLGREGMKGVEVEKWIAKAVFYVILLFVLVAFFDNLGLNQTASSLNGILTPILDYIPRLIEAGFVLFLAWVVASAARLVVSRVLGAAKMDKKLEDQAGIHHAKGSASLTKTLGDALYWLMFLLFLPAVLSALELDGLLGPVENMTAEILNYLPNIIAAGAFFVIGWFIARIVQRIVTNLLAAVGIDALGERVGLTAVLGTHSLSHVLGTVVHILIIIPVLIAALDALDIDAITQPATNMLDTVFGAIPAVFAAIAIMLFAYVVGRVIGELVSNLLSNIGLNTVMTRLGMSNAIGKKWKPSEIVGYLVGVAVVLFALVEAFELLGFTVLAGLAAEFIVFASHIIFGLVIFGIGLYLANVVSETIGGGKGKQSNFLANMARIAILVFAGAMALGQMGVADGIINIAFALLLGSIAIAIALAFGLGGRDVAARHLEEWSRSMKRKS